MTKIPVNEIFYLYSCGYMKVNFSTMETLEKSKQNV